MKLLFYLITILIPCNTFAGFAAETLIKTPSEFVTIENLCVGDTIECCANGHTNKITYKQSAIAKKCIGIELDTHKEPLIVSHDQQFYVPLEATWQQAKDLRSGQLLLKNNSEYVTVQNIYEFEDEVELFDITVDDCHTFFVSHDAILVHNFVPIVFTISFALGGGAIDFAGISLGMVALGGLIGLKICKDRKKKKKTELMQVFFQ